MSVVKPKPKLSQRPIKRKENTFTSQWEPKEKTNELPKARENESDRLVIGLSVAFLGLESGASFLDQSQSELKANKQSRITFDAQMKFF